MEFKSIARDPAQRTMLAVRSASPKISPVSSCVGLKGVRIKTIVKQLPGEKVDVVKGDERREVLIRNALAPALVERIIFDDAGHFATIQASAESRALILDQPTRLRLLSRLVGCEMRIMDPA